VIPDRDLARGALDQAIEGDEEVPHRLIVLVELGELEERLDEAAVVRPIAAVVEVAKQHPPREGANVAVPGIGERLELLRRRGCQELLEEALIAGREGFVEQERGGAGGGHRGEDATGGRPTCARLAA
jgi:hypothetical protein